MIFCHIYIDFHHYRFVGGGLITDTIIGLSQHEQSPDQLVYVRSGDVIGFRWYDSERSIPYTTVPCADGVANMRYSEIPAGGIDVGTLLQMTGHPTECRDYSLQAYIQQGGQ